MNRLTLAFKAFWGCLTDREAAARVAPALASKGSGPDLRVLALLQRDGRLVDFLLEDIDSFGDAQIGAAARDIHRGCKKVLRDYLTVEPVLAGQEDSPVSVPAGFDPNAIRLSGNVAGTPPFKGTLRHHGWRVSELKLPVVPGSSDPSAILAPAEVDIS